MAAQKKTKKTPASQAVEQFDYRGITIKVSLKDNEEQLTVGGKKVGCARDADTGAYIPDDSPYERFGSLQEMAKARIDSTEAE